MRRLTKLLQFCILSCLLPHTAVQAKEPLRMAMPDIRLTPMFRMASIRALVMKLLSASWPICSRTLQLYPSQITAGR